MSQYDKNNPKKKRQLWKRINDNEISISDLKKAGVKVKSLIYDKGIYIYSGGDTDKWQSWLGLYPFADITIYELKEFTEEMVPYLNSQLITKTAEDADGNPNQEYIDDLTDRILSGQHYWHYTYTIKAEENPDSSSGQMTYYLVSYISIWFHNSQFGDNKINYPLDYRQLITIDNLKYDEIIKDKS